MTALTKAYTFFVCAGIIFGLSISPDDISFGDLTMIHLLHSSTGMNRRGFTWIELLVVIIIIFVLLAILIPAMNHSSLHATRRMSCRNSLKQIGLAMHTYHDAHKAFPSAQILDADGKALHSWRVQILPYIEQQKLYEQLRFDEPWDSEHNSSLNMGPGCGFGFNCPNADIYRRDKAKINEETRKWLTDYQVVVGPLTAFERDRHTSLSAFERGTSNTYLAAEMTSAVPLFAPVDLPFELLRSGVVAPASGIQSVGSHHAGGVNVVFADGSADFVANSNSRQDIELLKTMFLLAEPKSSKPEDEIDSP